MSDYPSSSILEKMEKNSMFVKCVRTGDLCQFFIAPGMEILSELTTNRSKSCCVSIFGSWLRLKMAYTPEKWNSEKKSTAWKIDLGIPHSLTNPCALWVSGWMQLNSMTKLLGVWYSNDNVANRMTMPLNHDNFVKTKKLVN